MNQKQLDAIVDSIVIAVAAQNGLEDGEARTLVGIALRKNHNALLQAILIPTLGLVGETKVPVA
jgi:hypothetical protein